jgi:hypothetical protein
VSYESRTVADQQSALATLARIGAAFGDLPAAEFDVGRIYLGQVAVSLHDDLGDFEAWRVMLGIPVDMWSTGRSQAPPA